MAGDVVVALDERVPQVRRFESCPVKSINNKEEMR